MNREIFVFSLLSIWTFEVQKWNLSLSYEEFVKGGINEVNVRLI